MHLPLVGSFLVLILGWIGESHWYQKYSEIFWSYFKIHRVPLGTTRFQKLLEQSLTISNPAEGPNTLAFVFSNYTDIIYASQAILCVCRVSLQEALKKAIFLNWFRQIGSLCTLYRLTILILTQGSIKSKRVPSWSTSRWRFPVDRARLEAER